MSSPSQLGALPFASYVDAIGEEVDRLGQAGARGLEVAVPTCPGWFVADLLGHVAAVCRHWSVQLEAGDAGERTPVGDAGSGDGVLAGLEREATRLLGALARSGPDAPCWNWSGTDLVATWVARRLALETAVHRVDGELAFARPTPVEAELAVDGIDERLDVHLRVDLPEAPEATLGGSACLVCTDVDAAWVVEAGGGRLRWRHGRGPADAVLVGSASDLLLFTWNRVEVDALALTGRRDVALAWRTLPS